MKFRLYKLLIVLIITAASSVVATGNLNITELKRSSIMSESQNTKRISLTQGQFAIVDSENYEWLSKWKWYAYWSNHTKSYYARRNGKIGSYKQYPIYMAREILGLKRGDARQTDHVNHNTLDNLFVNLRIVTSQQNAFNRKNIKGYTLRRKRQVYRTRIRINGKLIHLGDFKSKQEAHKAYLKAKGKYHQI